MPGAFFDELETRSPTEREAAQTQALAGLIRSAGSLPGWAAHLAGVVPEEVTSRQALAGVPVLRKSALHEHQSATPPFGGFADTTPGTIARIFASPGPIYEPQARADDWQRMARALYAAGVRPGDLVHNTFGYHLTPGGWIVDAGARALNCPVIPAGPGNTDQQLQAIAHLRPSVYTGVPDFLKILLDKADEAGTDVSSLRRALVSGGPLFPSLREFYDGQGIGCLQCYATADVGLIAYESLLDGAPLPGMVVDEGVILEIVRPGTDDPVPDGEVGEVVVTAFNPAYPMIRLATGDLSAVLSEPSPCGRTNMRIKGWMGRADQTAKIKGMFVHPRQVADIARRHPELGRLRLVINREGERDVMRLDAEAGEGLHQDTSRLEETLAAATRLRGTVRLMPPGTLPNDGKVIADERDA